MHKYQPRLHILRHDSKLPPLENGGQSINLCLPKFCNEYKTFKFSETQFMAVTAYQNQLVCLQDFLKIFTIFLIIDFV